jgi:hypothetical protein
MRGDFDEDEDPDFEPDSGDGCNTCNGVGLIIVCSDDMCRGTGECIHDDGFIICPECKGEYPW